MFRRCLSIDPGLRATGVAVWGEGGTLSRAFLVKNDAPEDFSRIVLGARTGQEFDLVVVEKPQVYTRDKSIGDPNDLINLSVLAGMLVQDACLFGRPLVQLPTPREWKGNVPKEVIENRCKIDLTEDELANVVLPSARLAHNVWDAVGLGLWAFKKLRSARKR